MSKHSIAAGLVTFGLGELLHAHSITQWLGCAALGIAAGLLVERE